MAIFSMTNAEETSMNNGFEFGSICQPRIRADGGIDGDEKGCDPLEYRSRKPKWWTQLSGRRGTRAQRQATSRMIQRGYCLSKELLTEFSRVDNRVKQGNAEECDNHDFPMAIWKKLWWDRSLAILSDDGDKCYETALQAMKNVNELATTSSGNAEKYAYKAMNMFNHKNPLPSKSYEKVWLEIGFGNGDNLLANAKNHPDILFMGSEIQSCGIGAVLRRMEMEIGFIGADSTSEDSDGMGDKIRFADENSNDPLPPPVTLQSNSPHQNVRILPGDGVKLLTHLPNNYLKVILITFPDPWPKECHHHFRVIQEEVLREMQRVLCCNGRVFVATDAECFDTWTRKVFKQCSCDRGDNKNKSWEEVIPCPDRSEWLPAVSFYEQKGIDEGRGTMLQCWTFEEGDYFSIS
ncbi:hypothetical protein ACHAXS_004966 [Conticribra weissflogii]